MWNTSTPAGFDASQVGAFLHFVLERVTRAVMAEGGFAKVDGKALNRLTNAAVEEEGTPPRLVVDDPQVQLSVRQPAVHPVHPTRYR